MIDAPSSEDTNHEAQLSAPLIRQKSAAEAIALRLFLWIDALSARILWCLEHRSKSSRLFIASMLGLVCILSYRHGARAQTGLIDTELNTAYTLSSTVDLFDNAISLAQYLFGTLAALTVIYNVLAYYIRNQSVKGVGQVVLTSILRLGLPFVIIGLAPVILPSISLVGLQIAGTIAGNPTGPVANYTDAPPVATIQAPLTQLYSALFTNGQNVNVTPSNIAIFGEDIGFTILDKSACAVTGGTYAAGQCLGGTGQTGSGTSQSTSFQANDAVMQTITYLCISIIGTFVFIAVELVVAYLQVYLVLPIAAFSLGFLGSPATARYGSGYWTLVVSALLKFVTMVFTIGFAIDVATQWAPYVANANFNLPVEPQPGSNQPQTVDVGALKLAISIALSSFTLLFIVRTLPSLFAGLLTGNVGSADTSIESQAQALGTGGGSRGGPGQTPGVSPQSTGMGTTPRAGTRVR